jgi:transposase
MEDHRGGQPPESRSPETFDAPTTGEREESFSQEEAVLMAGRRFCPGCFEKQSKIDKLLEENERLRQKLRYEEHKAKEGFFGSSTPSSKIPFKGNQTGEHKPKGAKPGHRGVGRKRFAKTEADQIVPVAPDDTFCPNCGGPLENKGVEERWVIDSQPLKARRIFYRLLKKYCPQCKRLFPSRAPGVLPKSLYGNQLITTAAVMHYLHGIPMGRVCEQTQIGPGSLVEIFHRLAKLFEKIPARLIEQYRQAPVKHADETSWRTDGQNGYVWLFATHQLSIFQFRKSRSASVAQAVFGENLFRAFSWWIVMPGTIKHRVPFSTVMPTFCGRWKS